MRLNKKDIDTCKQESKSISISERKSLKARGAEPSKATRRTSAEAPPLNVPPRLVLALLVLLMLLAAPERSS